MRSGLACLPRFVIFPGLISRQGHIDMHAGGTEELDQLDIAFRPTRCAWQSRAVAV